MFNRIVAAWSALTTHMSKHREAKRAAKEIRALQIKIDLNYAFEMQSLPKTLAGIRTMKEAYYRKAVFLSDFASLEERADARIGGMRTVEEIEAIEDEDKRYGAKMSQIEMAKVLKQYCLKMWQLNAKIGSNLEKPI